jgi:4-amino-4-deoxy-L-arabinose transferase-like glycosyltransferase
MLESLLFIFLILIGGTFLIISLIVLLIGVNKKSSKLKKIALGIGIVPIMCFGLIAFWYIIAVPSFNNSEMEEFSGTYEIQTIEKGTDKSNSKLNLFADGTYKYIGEENVRIAKRGTWKTGGIDGHFEFYDENENLIEFASPFGGNGNKKIIFNLYDSNEVRFVKVMNE